MKHISDLFSKYKNNLQPPQSSVIKEFVSVCEEVIGIKIKPEHCSYVTNSKTIYLKTPGVIKSEILKKKLEILKNLNRKLGKNSPNEIV